MPEAAGGSHYRYLHNLFSLRTLPNIIYKISVGNALAAEQQVASKGEIEKRNLNPSFQASNVIEHRLQSLQSAVYNLLKSKQQSIF